MEDGIMVAVITIVLNAMVWLLQAYTNRKKNVAETRGIDSRAIKNLTDSVVQLQDAFESQSDEYASLAEDYRGLSRKLTSLDDSHEKLLRRNERIAKENKEMAASIEKMQKENAVLRGLILAEQEAKERLKVGIGKLINQMKEAGIEQPAFTLRDIL